MSLRVHPRSAPPAQVALGYLLTSTCAVLATGAFLFLPGVGQGLLLPLPLVHLMAVGVGVTALLGVSRHLALTLLHASPRRTQPSPLLHAAAVILLLAGFLAGNPPAIASGGAALLVEAAFITGELALALPSRRQFGTVHAYLFLSLASLSATLALGVRFAVLLASGVPPVPAALALHIGLGAAGTFVVAVVGTSLQLVPMFSASRPLPARLYWTTFPVSVVVLALSVALAPTGGPLSFMPFLLFWGGWVGILWERLGRGHPHTGEAFFLFGRLGELALGATGLLLLLGAPLPAAEDTFFFGFLLPTVFAYLTRLVPFLLWLRLTQMYGYEPSIPKLAAYLPPHLGYLVAPYALALLAFLLAPAPVAGLGRLLLGLCLVAGALALIRGFYVGLRWAPQSSPAHSASRLR